jgi:SAM-dependent methyltransferase
MMDRSEEMIEAARFFDLAIGQIAGLNNKPAVRALDFGCGAGALMDELAALGYQTNGCDIVIYSEVANNDRVKKILEKPYRIPFDDNYFDVVVSTSVLEHARNPDEYMPEICRVLKPGGYAMHIMPARHYLPSEPHIFIPLANFYWPHCPTWWFALWARLGRRATFQKNLSWRETVAKNREFYDNHTIYMSARRYDELSRRYFADHQWPMEFYIKHSYGGFAALARRIPIPKFWGWVSRQFRMMFLVQRKQQASPRAGSV